MTTRVRCINPDCPKSHDPDPTEAGPFDLCPWCGHAMVTSDAGDEGLPYPETRFHQHEPHWSETEPLSEDLSHRPPGVPPSPWNVAVGSIFAGRYKILKKLGQGGMGAVYLAHDGNLERVVALKIPSLAGAGPDFVKRFFREARAMAQLIHHPNICKVIDVVNPFNSVPYLTMEYVDGKTLSEVLKKDGRLPVAEAVQVVAKLARALSGAHTLNIIHRDLKPANVMIRDDGMPILMDFGLARRDGDERITLTNEVMGTVPYMSPEQVRGDNDAMGPGSDIYSLGVILYEALTGHRPFQGDQRAIVGRILTEDPAPPSFLRPDLSPRIEAICLKALAKVPADRHSSMAELADEIEALDRPDTTPAGFEAPPTGPYTPADPPGEAGPGPAPVPGKAPRRLPLEPDGLDAVMVEVPVPGKAPRRRPALSIVGTVIVALAIPVAIYQFSRHRNGPERPPTPVMPTPLPTPPEPSKPIAKIDPPPEAVPPVPKPKDMEKTPEGPAGPSPADPGRDRGRGPVKPPVPRPGREIRSASTGMTLVLVEPGRFEMGSKKGDPDELPTHGVTIGRAFFLGKYEVTQDQYGSVTGETPSHFVGDGRRPVEGVSWPDAVRFCNALSLKDGLPPFYTIKGDDVSVLDWSATGYRLPTESEWEYACRAGRTGEYGSRDDEVDLPKQAWFGENARVQGSFTTHAEGPPAAPSNPFGLRNMQGNVWEWCWDRYAKPYPPGELAAPIGPDAGNTRVLRGGSYNSSASILRPAARNHSTPEFKSRGAGFRAARHEE